MSTTTQGWNNERKVSCRSGEVLVLLLKKLVTRRGEWHMLQGYSREKIDCYRSRKTGHMARDRLVVVVVVEMFVECLGKLNSQYKGYSPLS